jgi:acetolactate synthase-1/2/3 large subunit
MLFKSMQNFVDKTCIPFFNTQMGKGVVSCENPLFLGTAALSDGDVLHRVVEIADLIINIGHDSAIIASLSSPRRTSATIRCGNKG